MAMRGAVMMEAIQIRCSPRHHLEKPSPFKSLKSQELVKLRKLIEKGNEVKKLVWENPRYLVSSGDFPTILHEGCRYNALHVSTKALNAPMTDLLLETIGDPAFTTLLYDGPPTAHTYIERWCVCGVQERRKISSPPFECC
uniref:Ankyrin repeat and LEM domain-containing protein 2 n=1 Tax=Cacopsylla melanoneura TaxID=428564 RepID=A0A8D8R530_9HEMI